MAISFVAAGAVTSFNGNTNVSVPSPTGVADGDLVLLIAVDYTGAITANPIVPAEFTLVWQFPVTNPAFTTGYWIYRKIANGEPANYTCNQGFVNGGGSGKIFSVAYRGVTSWPRVVTGGPYAQGTTTPTAGAVTANAAGQLYLGFVEEYNGRNLTVSGTGVFTTRASSSTNGVSFCLADTITTGAGSVSGTFSSSGFGDFDAVGLLFDAAPYYLDLENGNDSNDGLSYAKRWKTVSHANSVTVAGDTVRVMASADPIDTRTAASWPGRANFSLFDFLPPNNQNEVVINNATNFLDSTLYSGSPCYITTKVKHGLSTGDYVAIQGAINTSGINGIWKITVLDAYTATLQDPISGANLNIAGATSDSGVRFFRINGTVITLASALSKRIMGSTSTCPSWTVSPNVSITSTDTYGVEGAGNNNLSIATSFAGGKIAYYTLPSTLDLSAYQQLSFYFRGQFNDNLPLSAGYLQVKLCSDSVGNTPVNTFNLPAYPNNNNQYQATPVVVDNGSALSSTVNSIAIYSTTDFYSINGAQLVIENINACYAPSDVRAITHNSFVSVNGDPADPSSWMNIQQLHDTLIILDGNGHGPAVGSSGAVVGMYGAAKTGTLVRREPINVNSNGDTGTYITISANGSSGLPITYDFGWDRTLMAQKSGQTILDKQYYSYIFNITGNYITLKDPWGIRGSLISINGSNFIGENLKASANPSVSILPASSSQTYQFLGHTQLAWSAAMVNNGVIFLEKLTGFGCATQSTTPGLGLFDQTNPGSTYIQEVNSIASTYAVSGFNGTLSVDTVNASYNSIGIVISSYQLQVGCYNASNNFEDISNSGGLLKVNSYNTSGSYISNIIGGLVLSPIGSIHSMTYIGKVTGPASIASTIGPMYPNYGSLTWSNATDYVGTLIINDLFGNGPYHYNPYGTITTSASVVRSRSKSWKLTPKSINASSATWGLITGIKGLTLPVARVFVEASRLVTCTAWLYRTSTGIDGQLRVLAGQLSGMTSDASASITGTNGWEKVSVSFTPTEAGTFELTVHALCTTAGYGTAFVYIDDVNVVQA